MRASIVFAIIGSPAAASLSIMAGHAPAAVVASYRGDFQPGGTPAAGWSYLWNANGPVGNSTNYAALSHDTGFGGDYETVANGTLPDPAPGSDLYAGPTTVYPGQAAAQASDGVERYVILAYTLSAADVAKVGGGPVSLSLGSYSFSPDATINPATQNPFSDGINARLYLNNTLLRAQPLPPGFAFTSAAFGTFPLGTANAGDTLSIAIGASGPASIASGGTVPGNDSFDTVTLDYTINVDPTPEPAGPALLALGASGLLARRRRRQ